jgi:hypothetical protein
MRLRTHLAPLCAAVVAITLAGPCASLLAAGEADFRIENQIFVGADKEARIRTTTIFQGGVVYDYLEDPAEVTVFDQQHGRFVLLDLTRRIKTELTTKQVLDFTERLKQWSQGQSDPFLRFLGDPQFDAEFDDASGELTLTSPWMTYRLTTGDLPSTATSSQYREFSDWYCRLNTMLNPGARPPFSRMAVNSALEEQQRFARAVHLTIKPRDGLLAKRLSVRSEHRLIEQLVESDRKRVAQTDQFMAMFASVDFREYQRKIAD